MLREPLSVSILTANREQHNLPQTEKPTIKILLYTDDPSEVVEAPVGRFGLGRMIELLKGHAPAFADLCVRWESRYPDATSGVAKKINVLLKEEAGTGKPFDQIWFFGLHQVNKKEFLLGLNEGGPQSELDADEIAELRRWMDNGGGVLITGDHANEPPADMLPADPNSPCPDEFRNEPFLGLGRALGRCVPRAGLLRDWEGLPTSRREESNNTQTITFSIPGTSFDDESIFQRDSVPQQLILQAFDEKGRPAQAGQPHPLFFYRTGRAIQLFPDHLHEGAVVIPEAFDVCLWPKNKADGFQPLPRVVAYGLDKRDGRKLSLVAAYDGAAAGVGRIVADSTWHHYFNINLSLFKIPEENSATDQIGQFYGNLALWLSSTRKRFEMTDAMVRWLARHPLVVEELGPTPASDDSKILNASATAYRLLTDVASPCEIHELVQLTVPGDHCEKYETLYLPERGFNLSYLPSKAVLLGHLINQHPWKWMRKQGLSLSDDKGRRAISEAFRAGFKQAFHMQSDMLAEAARLSEKFGAKAYFNRSKSIEREEPAQGFEATLNVSQPAERSSDMTICKDENWDMELVVDDGSGESEFVFFTDVKIVGGKITGRVIDVGGHPFSNLSGTCTPFRGPDVSLMSFRFNLIGSTGVPVGIFLAGYAFQPATSESKPTFRGKFYAFAPTPDLPLISTTRLKRLILGTDPGDTGTGTGQQT